MVNYSQLIGEALVMMERPSMVDSLSSGAPMKDPRWDLADTKGCGGGNSFSWCSWMFSGYVDIYIGGRSRSVEPRGGHEGGGVPTPLGRAGHPRGRLVCCLTSTPSLLVCICFKKIAPEGFIPFGLSLIFFFFETPK